MFGPVLFHKKFFGFRGYWLLIFLPKERRVPKKNVVFGIWFKERGRGWNCLKSNWCAFARPHSIIAIDVEIMLIVATTFSNHYPSTGSLIDSIQPFFLHHFPNCRLASVHTLQESFKMYKMDITDACFWTIWFFTTI